MTTAPRYYYLKEKDKPETGGWSPCIASSNDHSPEPDPTPDPGPTDPLAPVTFKTCGKDLTYGKIISPKTGRIWLDRNLGAERTPVTPDDIKAMGSLYQWGRAGDGHECVEWLDNGEHKMSAQRNEISKTDTPGHGDFIWPSKGGESWFEGIHKSEGYFLWNKGSDGTVPNNPCPKGFRPPTAQEVEAEYDKDYRSMKENLKFGKIAARRSGVNGGNTDYGSSTNVPYIWISTRNYLNKFESLLPAEGRGFGTYGESANYGHHVRCIKDEGEPLQVN